MLESEIQASIVRYLWDHGMFCHSVPNEQSHGNPVRTGQLISMGMYPGVADLIVWLGDGKVAYLEVKTPEGKQSEKQQKFEQRCINKGYPYAVVHSISEVEQFLKQITT